MRKDLQSNSAEWENITFEDYLEAMEALIMNDVQLRGALLQ
ncbi:DUF7660 family protein [Viridibacillus sp. FSL E2-0187]